MERPPAFGFLTSVPFVEYFAGPDGSGLGVAPNLRRFSLATRFLEEAASVDAAYELLDEVAAGRKNDRP